MNEHAFPHLRRKRHNALNREDHKQLDGLSLSQLVVSLSNVFLSIAPNPDLIVETYHLSISEHRNIGNIGDLLVYTADVLDLGKAASQLPGLWGLSI